jgi:hypothetical protein
VAVAAVAAAAMANGERLEVRDEYHTNVIGVPGILLGNYLVQSRAMFLANAYLHLSQCLASRQTLSVPQIDLSAHADRKMVIFMSICVIYKEITILQNRYADKQFGVQRKKPSHTILCVSAYLYIF